MANVMEEIKSTSFRMLGQQYYRYMENDEVDLIRIVYVKNDKEIKIVNKEGEIIKTDVDNIKDGGYTLLKPDGMITISSVNMGKDSKSHNVEDVVVCLYRQIDLDNKVQDPFVVCRQNITDFFANYLLTTEENDIVGVSVSKTSCPENIPFDRVMSCNGILDSIVVNIYIEDTVESILAFCKKKMKVFNRILEANYEDHLRHKGMINIGKSSVDGYCLTLKQLLLENNFQYDYDSAYNIIKINAIIDNEVEEVNDELLGNYYQLPNYISNELSKLLKEDIRDTIVVPYNHELDLSDLEGTKYLILRDNNNMLYIINYISSGEYRESDLEVIAAQQAIDRMSYFSSSINKDKYKGRRFK